MTSIFVAKLDFGVSKEQLTALFEEYGKVSKVNIPTDKDTGKPRGFAFVEMFDADEANNAISALDGYEVNRRRLAVKEAENRNDRSRPSNNGNREQRSSSSAPRNTNNTDQSASVPTEEPKNDSRKKPFKGKSKSYDSDQGGGGKKAKKMTAHKKSGKNFRYFDDDEPIEGGLFSFDNDDDETTD